MIRQSTKNFSVVHSFNCKSHVQLSFTLSYNKRVQQVTSPTFGTGTSIKDVYLSQQSTLLQARL